MTPIVRIQLMRAAFIREIREIRGLTTILWLLQSCDMDEAIGVRRGPALYEFKTAGKMPAPQIIGPLSGRSAVQSVLRELHGSA